MGIIQRPFDKLYDGSMICDLMGYGCRLVERVYYEWLIYSVRRHPNILAVEHKHCAVVVYDRSGFYCKQTEQERIQQVCKSGEECGREGDFFSNMTRYGKPVLMLRLDQDAYTYLQDFFQRYYEEYAWAWCQAVL